MKGTYEERLRAMRSGDEPGIAHYVMVNATEVGDWEHGDVRLRGRLEIPEHLRGRTGGVATGVLLTVADNIAGFTAGLAAAPDGWVVTTNLMAEILRAGATGPLELESQLLRAGRSAVVARAGIVDLGADRAPVAEVLLTSSVLQPEGGAPNFPRPAALVAVDLPPERRPTVPFEEYLDIRADGPGRHVMEARDDLRNPWGFIHGGVVAALVDTAAVDTAAAALGAPGALSSVVVHYLAPNRAGPLIAHGRVIGRRSDAVVVRVELRDRGEHDRCTVVAIATVDPI